MLTWHHTPLRAHDHASLLVEAVWHEGLRLLRLFVDLVSLVDVVFGLDHLDLAEGGHFAHGLHVFQAGMLLFDLLQLFVDDFLFNFFLNVILIVVLLYR